MVRPPQPADATPRHQTTGTAAAGRYHAALFELGDRLLNIDDLAEMAFVAAEIAGRCLGACRAGYGTVDAARGRLEVARDWTMPGFQSLAGTRRYFDADAYQSRLARGEPILLGNVAQEASPDSAPAWLAVGARAVINLPVFERATLVAVVYVHGPEPRLWRADELAFLYDLAERTRSAVERRRAEQELRALNRRLEREVAERTADRNRLWQLSTEIMLVAQPDGTIMATNPAWHAALGWTPHHLAGRLLTDLVHPDDAAATAALLQRLAAGRLAEPMHNRCRHRNGSYRWIAWNAVPGEGLINAVGRDVTVDRATAAALAQAEEQLRQAAKMEAVGQLTGGLAHDFNNLLQAVSGSLELASRRLAAGRVDETARFLAGAQDTVGRAATLIQRLLAFARRQTLDPRLVQPGALVLDMADLVARTMGPAITVTVDVADGAGSVMCDSNQLENALLNLAINARDAMPSGGALRITVQRVPATVGPGTGAHTLAGPYVELTVSDTGTGMDAETRARAFEPFFTTKPIGSGTGLGLSQTYGFVQQSGGFVSLDSQPGQGTTVRLLLPCHTGPDASHSPPGAAGPAILLVADQSSVRQLVTEHLQEAGFTVRCADDAPAALRLLQDGTLNPAAMVTEIGPPGSPDGRTLADRARTILPGLPVLMVTGHAGDTADESLPPGMAVLGKPLGFDTLTARLRTMLAPAQLRPPGQ